MMIKKRQYVPYILPYRDSKIINKKIAVFMGIIAAIATAAIYLL